MCQVEAVAVKSRGGGIIKNRLIGELDIEDGLQDNGCFPSRHGERDIESQDKSEDIFGVMDFCKIDGRLIGCRMQKFLGLVVILSVLIAEFELGSSLFLKMPLGGIKLCDGLEAMRAVIV
jgi:hypothetical protein